MKLEQLEGIFGRLRGAFSRVAEFQGPHFRYAKKNGVLLLEIRKDGRFNYWIFADELDGPKLIHSSIESRLKRMQAISDSTLRPSTAYD